MMENWADVVADAMVGRSPLRKGRPGSPDAGGTLLLLGAADTGKTTLMAALAARLTQRGPVALVDADTGQSHIGPPTTVGWTLREARSRAPGIPEARGIAFVGDITPVGHLLQLLAALALCVEQARQVADIVLIDTPGLVTGGAACSLWWTVQRLLRPQRIVALHREDEMAELLGGLEAGISAIEKARAPAKLRRKSPEARQEHRRRLFEAYFREATDYALSLRGLAVRATPRMPPESVIGRIVGLSDAMGQDIAIGVVTGWQPRKPKMVIRAPVLDIGRVRCVTIGHARIDISSGWS